MRLSSVDFPALGRPRKETNPDFIRTPSSYGTRITPRRRRSRPRRGQQLRRHHPHEVGRAATDVAEPERAQYSGILAGTADVDDGDAPARLEHARNLAHRLFALGTRGGVVDDQVRDYDVERGIGEGQ